MDDSIRNQIKDPYKFLYESIVCPTCKTYLNDINLKECPNCGIKLKIEEIKLFKIISYKK